MITTILNILLQLPEIKNYDDIGLKSFLIFVILALSMVLWHLWNRLNKLSDKIAELQTDFQRQILDAHEKTLTALPSIEKAMLDSNINVTEKVINAVRSGHEKIIQEINSIK